MLKFQTSPLFDQTVRSRSENTPGLRNKLAQFVRVKSADPTASFGSSDKPFRSGGFFTNAVPKIKHAHLTPDLSVVYVLVGGAEPVMRLYGVFSHDDLGTGTPANINRQRSMAAQLAGQQFVDAQPQAEPTAQPAAKTAAAKPNYQPRPRQAQPATASAIDQALALANQTWPQRNLQGQFDQTRSREEQLNVIKRELNYLEAIMRRYQLYPNQKQYGQQVVNIYRQLLAAK